jgi:lipopolysaccharide export LptBFGC system permease protein LptF
MTKIKYSSFKYNNSSINPNIPSNHNSNEIQNKYKNYYKEPSSFIKKKSKQNIELFTNYNSIKNNKEEQNNDINEEQNNDINEERNNDINEEKTVKINKNKKKWIKKTQKNKIKNEDEEDVEEKNNMTNNSVKNEEEEKNNMTNNSLKKDEIKNKETFINKVISFLITIFFLTILAIIIYFLYMYFFKKINIFSKFQLSKNNFLSIGGANKNISKINITPLIQEPVPLLNNNDHTNDNKIINDILNVLKKFEN